MVRFFLAGLLVLVLSSAAVFYAERSSAGPSMKISLEELRNRNPEAEAKAALEQGDRRLVGVRSFSLQVPGSGMELSEAERHFGVVAIEKTIEYINAPDKDEYQDLSRKYAIQYNRYILEHAPLPSP